MNENELRNKLKTAEQRIYYLERENAIIAYNLETGRQEVEEAKKINAYLSQELPNKIRQISEAHFDRFWKQPSPLIANNEPYEYVTDIVKEMME